MDKRTYEKLNKDFESLILKPDEDVKIYGKEPLFSCFDDVRTAEQLKVDPIEQRMRKLGGVMAKKLDEAISAALDVHLGPGWDANGLAGRLISTTGPGRKFSTYYCDGVPILNVWPITIDHRGLEITANQRIQHLLAVKK
jgi:hypothetical protein